MNSPKLQGLFLTATLCLYAANAFADDTALSFFKPYQATAATISPSGHLVALGEQVDEHAIVSVLTTDRLEKTEVFRGLDLLQTEQSYISDLQWIDDRFLAVVVTESRQAVAELVDTKYSRSAYIVDTIFNEINSSRTIYTIKTRGTFVSALPGRDGEILFSKSGNVSRLFRINVQKLNALGAKMSKRTLVDGGQFTKSNEVATLDGFVLRWFTAPDGSVRSAFAITRDRELVLMSMENGAGEWETLKSWSIGSHDNEKENEENTTEQPELFIPLAAGESRDEFYTVLENEGQTDGLYTYNTKTDDRTLVYRHPTADIYRVLLDRATQAIRGVGIVDRGVLRYDYIRESSKIAFDEVQNIYGDQSIKIVDSDRAEKFFVLSAQSFSRPGSFILWDTSASESATIADAMPWLVGNQEARLVVDSTYSHDLEIPYLLTLPDSENGPHPLVLLPHGGPIGALDERNFNPATQFLASQGFAVLQVNYRGSAGYSDEFLEAGKKEWGAKILDDIMTVYDSVVTRADIDSNRTCIFGGSYGGYAAMILGIRHPEKFRCIGSIAGVSDINLTLSRRDSSDASRDWQREYIGNTETEFEALAVLSPAYIAEKTSIPIFFAHGTDDDVVDIEHAYRMKYALDLAGKDYEFHILQDVGHNLGAPEQVAGLYVEIVEFLKIHLTNKRQVSPN